MRALASLKRLAIRTARRRRRAPSSPPAFVWLALCLLWESRLGAEDHVDYKYEVYSENADRILVRTHSALAEASLTPWLGIKGQYVYDGISGATPTGGPPPPGSKQVPLANLEDARNAAYVEPVLTFGAHTLRPQIAYSTEHDYESIAPSLNYQVDLNQRNTTINLGVAHNFDRLTRGTYLGPEPRRKDSTDMLMGVSQVLGPTTLLNVSLTLGTASGYLSDPYKGFRFTQYPDPNALFPEKRPDHRTKEIPSVGLNQFFEPVDGAADLSYRFYHDSFGIVGHTVTLEWLQHVGRYVVIAPLFRYYHQTAADFYLRSFDADPSDPSNPNNAFIPQFYSADYRLSALRTLTYGVGLSVKVQKRVLLDAAYKRYSMIGLDGVTPASSYVTANVYTIGIRVFF